MAFETYYQNELTYLREMGREFARAHPAAAGLLAERGTDPDVERLFEGFAFLAARIHQRMDSALPSLADGLAEMLIPHFCRVTPACTTLEFRPDDEAVRARQRVPKGTVVRSKPVQGTACEFRTCADLVLLPLTITGQHLQDASATEPRLDVSFRTTPGATESAFTAEPLRLHLHGDLALSSHLLLWMLRHCRDVVVEAGGGRVSLGAGAVRWPSITTEASLWPSPNTVPKASSLLLEYFTLPSKLLYVDIFGLERAAHLGDDTFSLSFRFHHPPPFPGRIPERMVRLHCVPAANLFHADAVPISLEPGDGPRLVRANGFLPEHTDVFSVDRVVGLTRGRTPVEYESFYSFRHALRESHGVYYEVGRQASPVDDSVHHTLRLVAGRESGAIREQEKLSIALTCTNGSLPNQLQIGDVCVPSSGVPGGVACGNIEGVTKPCRPPVGSETIWRLLTYLAVSRRALSDAAVLKRLLELYNWQQYSDVVGARANESRIAAIREVRAAPATRVIEGAAVRGYRYDIEVDAKGFASVGDAFLFGAILDELYGGRATINSFSEVALTLHPVGDTFRWAAHA